MQVWHKLLRDLRDYLDVHLAGMEHDQAIKLANAVETEFLYELRGGRPGPKSENTVAMTPAPYGILQRPDPACTHCGMVMQVRHTGGLTYVIDHGPPGPACPNAWKMWKMTAAYIPFDEQVLVPAFVREAMAKNS